MLVYERASVWRPIVAAGVVTLIASFALVAVLLGCLLLVAFTGYGLSRARHMRRNNVERVAHGLEHACIALLKTFGHDPTEGRTKDNSFIVGLKNSERATASAVRQATEDAIRRVRNGQHELAFTPNCGTSLMVRFFLTAVAMTGGAIALLANGFTIPTLIGSVLAYIAARLVAYPLGLLIQHTMTVSTRFASARVVNVHRTSDDESDKKKVLFVVELEVIA